MFPPKIPQHLPLGQSESFSQRKSVVLILRERACLTVPGNPTGHAWCSAPEKTCNNDQSRRNLMVTIIIITPLLSSASIHSICKNVNTILLDFKFIYYSNLLPQRHGVWNYIMKTNNIMGEMHLLTYLWELWYYTWFD